MTWSQWVLLPGPKQVAALRRAPAARLPPRSSVGARTHTSWARTHTPYTHATGTTNVCHAALSNLQSIGGKGTGAGTRTGDPRAFLPNAYAPCA